jgi:hypothetical protein
MIRKNAIPGQGIAPHMTYWAWEDPPLSVFGEQPSADSSSAPEASQHRSAQKQVERPFFSVLGFHDPQNPPLNVEMLPLELNQCIPPQATEQREQMGFSMMFSW